MGFAAASEPFQEWFSTGFYRFYRTHRTGRRDHILMSSRSSLSPPKGPFSFTSSLYIQPCGAGQGISSSVHVQSDYIIRSPGLPMDGRVP